MIIKKYFSKLIILFVIVSATLFINYKYKRYYIKNIAKANNYDYTLNATQLDMKLGCIFSVYAVGNDAPKVKWYSSNTSIARINSYGQVIAMNPGQAIITAKYKKQCKDMIINVYKSASQDILIYKDSTTVATAGEALNKININTYILTLSKNKYKYTGKKIKPKISITAVDGTKLTKNKDYTVKYQNNKEAGNAQVLVTGIGDYTGSLVGTFKIVKPENESSSFSNDESSTTSSTNTNYGNDNSTLSTILTPTSPENSKVSSTRTQAYTGSTTKSNSLTNNSTKSSKKTTTSSSSNKKKSTSKKKNTSSDTTKSSFTKSKSSTSKNSFSKSSSSTSNSTNNEESSNSNSENSSSSDNNSSTNDSTSNSTSTNNDTNSTSDSTQTDNSSSTSNTTE